MTFKECYSILGVAQTAKLDDVKRAYRRRAFELHPDLNPNLVDAGRQFQLLNEAYVILTRVLTEREAKAEAAGRKNAERTERAERAARPEGHADSRPEADGKSETHGQTGGQSSAQAEGTSQPHEESRGSGPSASSGSSSASSHTGQHDAGGHTDAGADSGYNAESEADARKRRMADSAYAQQEDVLRDILNDQFARRVFEDIYSEVNRQQGGKDGHALGNGQERKAVPSAPPKPRKVNLEWGDKLIKLDFTGGFTGMVGTWLRHQIDDNLTVHLPRAKLFPGARVRLQIRQGFTKDLRVVEITLPPDFRTGKPFRLKGLGRKVGKWTGDLYVTIEAQQ